MKAIVCELCGSNDIVKQGEFYICQHCGTKYSLEEAKKLLGTVKIDTSEELKNLYQLARRARNDDNSENAQKYYEQILVKDPSSWEANFYSVYYQSMNTNIAGIRGAAIRVTNCEDTVLKLIEENVTDETIRYNAVDEVAARCISIADLLFTAAKNHYWGIGDSIRGQYTQEYLDRACASRDIIYYLGNYIEQMFGEEYAKGIGIHCWKTGIKMHQVLMPMFANKEANKNCILEYANKIQKYDSTYQKPSVSTSSGGCYIATAIYGSYDCPQVWTLRRFRDYTLAETWYGRAFIHIYYAISPIMVKWFGGTEWFRNIWKPSLDKMVERLNNQGVADTSYTDRTW